MVIFAEIRIRPTAERGEVVDWAGGFIAKDRLQGGPGAESKGKAGRTAPDSPKGREMPRFSPCEASPPCSCSSHGLVPLRAQWQIFAEKLPAPGTWASFRMETLREGKVVSTGDLRFSVRPGREVEGKPHVWFTVEPVMWLGSRERAPLRLLVRPDMDRKAASRLIENAAEIVFSNPVKGRLPHDAGRHRLGLQLGEGLRYTSELTLDEPAAEKLDSPAQTFACERLRMVATTVTDPPVVTKQTIEFKGRVWRGDASAFGVVRAEWEEKTTKGSEVKLDTKRLTWLAQGKETPPTDPVDRGKEFSVWRLIFKR